METKQISCEGEVGEDIDEENENYEYNHRQALILELK